MATNGKNANQGSIQSLSAMIVHIKRPSKLIYHQQTHVTKKSCMIHISTIASYWRSYLCHGYMQTRYNIIWNLILPPGIEQRDRHKRPASWAIHMELQQTRQAGHHKSIFRYCRLLVDYTAAALNNIIFTKKGQSQTLELTWAHTMLAFSINNPVVKTGMN